VLRLQQITVTCISSRRSGGFTKMWRTTLIASSNLPVLLAIPRRSGRCLKQRRNSTLRGPCPQAGFYSLRSIQLYPLDRCSSDCWIICGDTAGHCSILCPGGFFVMLITVTASACCCTQLYQIRCLRRLRDVFCLQLSQPLKCTASGLCFTPAAAKSFLGQSGGSRLPK